MRPQLIACKSFGAVMLSGVGPGAAIKGFKSAPMGLTRSDVENWLAEKQAQQAKSTLAWARIAGLPAIGSVLVGIITVAVTIWLAKR